MSFYEEYAELLKANKLPFNRPLKWFDKYKDRSCKKCYGRGYKAIDIEGRGTPCKCAIKNFLKTTKNEENKNV